jgi:CrcB protein
MIVLAVALFGAAGCVCRYLISVGLTHLTGDRFPAGTFAVNVIGAFLIGLVTAVFVLRGEADSRLRMAITGGFLGGFTTYSSFALETVTFLERRAVVTAALYVIGTLVVAGAACAVGLWLGRSFR